MASVLDVEPLGAKDTGRCECCGRVSRTAWGLVKRDGKAHATYFVHWTIGHVFENGAHIDLVLGRWGDETSAGDRYAVRLDYRIFDHGPELMVRDAERRYVNAGLAAHCLKRSDVIGGPLAQPVFEICDAVLVQDLRLSALWERPEGN
jgi:hypothetical protein